MKKLFSKALDILKHPRGWSLIVFYALFAATLAAAGAQAGRFPLPHGTGAEETGGQPDTPGVLLL